jgi:hypothetical protein
MTLNFPNDPDNGDIFDGFIWDSTLLVWKKISSPGPTGPTGAAGSTATAFVTGPTGPASPESGDIWFNTDNGVTSVWYADGDSNQWVQIAEGGLIGPTGPTGTLVLGVSSSSPTGPNPGQLWYDSDDGKIYFYYNDGDSSQWVEIASTIAPTGPIGPTGPMGDFSASYNFNPQVAGYSLVLSDAGRIVEISNGSATNLTIPLASSQDFPLGTNITVLQTGAGQITLNPTGGVTLNGTPGLKLRTQWSSATLIKRATNTWVAIGDLVP